MDPLVRLDRRPCSCRPCTAPVGPLTPSGTHDLQLGEHQELVVVELLEPVDAADASPPRAKQRMRILWA
jgi:hypothetical protein